MRFNLKKLYIQSAVLLTLSLLLCGCSAYKGKPADTDLTPESKPDMAERCAEAVEGAIKREELFDGRLQIEDRREFLAFIMTHFGGETLLSLCDSKGGNAWHALTGNTLNVLIDMYSGHLSPNGPAYREDISLRETDGSIVIRAVGDICLGEQWYVSPRIDSRGKGISGVADSDVLELLRSADITIANNEFCFSDRGRPMVGKKYTFRALPGRVSLLSDMGIDIVSLANNHVYDFGAEAFTDTLATLDSAKIARIGAGESITEAAKPHYFIAGGRKIAFTAATRAEKYILTPQATENSSGVMRTYDPEEYLEVISAAERECDINIAYVHWSREGSNYYEKDLPALAKKYIDAGADIIIGAHAHQLQGIEIIDGVPVIYNLGDFLFDLEKTDSAIFEIEITPEGNMNYRFIPCYQENVCIHLAEGEEKDRLLELMNRLSVNVTLDESGLISLIP